MHKESSSLVGKTVRIKKSSKHFQQPKFGGGEYRVEDWWDKLTGKSWMNSNGNPACMVYGRRGADNCLPIDDEVVYGKMNGLGHLVHISEIETEGN